MKILDEEEAATKLKFDPEINAKMPFLNSNNNMFSLLEEISGDESSSRLSEDI